MKLIYRDKGHSKMGRFRKPRVASKNLNDDPIISPIGWKTLFKREKSSRSVRLEDIVIEARGIPQFMSPKPIRKIQILRKEKSVQFADLVNIR